MIEPVACATIEEGCITCGDVAVEMRIVSADHERGLALCEAADGARSTVETGLVACVDVGEVLLVHAGTALVHLDPDALAPDEEVFA
jgi:hydrogenase maturation factor